MEEQKIKAYEADLSQKDFYDNWKPVFKEGYENDLITGNPLSEKEIQRIIDVKTGWEWRKARITDEGFKSEEKFGYPWMGSATRLKSDIGDHVYWQLNGTICKGLITSMNPFGMYAIRQIGWSDGDRIYVSWDRLYKTPKYAIIEAEYYEKVINGPLAFPDLYKKDDSDIQEHPNIERIFCDQCNLELIEGQEVFNPKEDPSKSLCSKQCCDEWRKNHAICGNPKCKKLIGPGDAMILTDKGIYCSSKCRNTEKSNS